MNKFKFFSLFVFIIFLVTACSLTNKSNIDEKKYKDNLGFQYSGINGQVFNYKILNDSENLCEIEDKLFKNREKVNVICKNEKLKLDFTKEFLIDNLLDGDIESPTVQNVTSALAYEDKYYLLKQTGDSFSYIQVKKDVDGSYILNHYDDAFVFKGNIVSVQNYDKNKLYTDQEYLSRGPNLKATGLEEQYLKTTLTKYTDQGFILYEEK